MPEATRQTFAFLYQSEHGEIDAPTWRRAALPLVALFAAATIVWLLLRPYTARGLTERSFFDAGTLAANIYLLVYSLAVILLAISWVNLSAKRFRHRGLAPAVGLAGVLPLVVLGDGAVRWLQPQIADAMPRWSVFVGDAAVAAALAWTVAECADLFARRRRPT